MFKYVCIMIVVIRYNTNKNNNTRQHKKLGMKKVSTILRNETILKEII